MSDNLQFVLERARRLRQEFRGKGEFTQEQFAQALAAQLPGYDANDVALIARTVDREALAQSSGPQAQFDLEGEYELRGGRRVAKAMATRGQMEEHLALDDERVARFRERN
jgi:hypothetical protein